MIRTWHAIWAICLMAVVTHSSLAQMYPFFVQPMSVDDVRVIAEELELSRQQRLAILNSYADYNQSFEELQEGQVKDFMDRAMEMGLQFQWWGGQVTIPPREEITDLVNEALGTIRAFADVDDAFFDNLTPLLNEAQLIRIEQERLRRALGRLSMLHRNLVEEINEGAEPDLLMIMRRIEISDEKNEVIEDILNDHAARMLAAMRKFERAGRDAVEAMLDEVDRMGLRQMDMAGMMQFFADEERQAQLKVLFDELTKPLQEASAAASRENLRAYRSLMDVLPEDQARDLRRRFVKTGYWDVSGQVFDLRDRLVRQQEKYEGLPEALELTDAVTTLDDGYVALEPAYLTAIHDQRTYRTMSQLEGDVPLTAADRTDSLQRRREAIETQARAVLERFEEDDAEAKSKKANATKEVKEIDYAGKMEITPLSGEQVQQMGAWLGANEEALAMMAMLQEDYYQRADSAIRDRGKVAMREWDDFEFDDEDGRRSWRERRDMWQSHKEKAAKAVTDLEAALFNDLSLSLSDDIDRARIENLRSAMNRSRSRSMTGSSDWQLGRQKEANLDLAAMILSTDPQGLTPEARRGVLDQLLAYDAAVTPLYETLVERAESTKRLEARLWGNDESYEPEVRAAMRRTWEKRRAAVNEAAEALSQLNRDMLDQIVAAVPESVGWALKDTYERSAYKGLFEGDESLDEAIAQISALDLPPAQRARLDQAVESYRTSWSSLTREMVKARQMEGGSQSFPPTRESMEAGLLQSRLRYRRAQLDQRTLVELELLLEPAQLASVPALDSASDDGGK